MRVKVCDVPSRHRRPWSPAEKRRLLFLRESGWRLEAIAARMGRSPTQCAVVARALGYGGGTPHGYESIKAAAARTNYCVPTLRRILAYAEVQTFEVLSKPFAERKGRYRQHFVDPVEVDEAIALWCKTEPVAVAARRHGIDKTCLMQWLRRTGWIEPTVPGTRPHRRIESSILDTLVATYRQEASENTRKKRRRAARIRWARHRQQHRRVA